MTSGHAGLIAVQGVATYLVRMVVGMTEHRQNVAAQHNDLHSTTILNIDDMISRITIIKPPSSSLTTT